MLIHRYVFRELLGPTLLGLVVYSSLLIIQLLFDLAKHVYTTQQIQLADAAMQLVYAMPSVLVQTIPMSVLLGILIGFSRLSADSEIVALRATGISYFRLLVPTALLAVLGWACSGAVYLWAVPWSNTQVVEQGLKASLKADLNREITPGEWQRIDDVAIFARGLEEGDDGRPWLSDVDILIRHPTSLVREHWHADRMRVERLLSGERRGRLRFDLRDVRGVRWQVDQPEGNIQLIAPARSGDRLGPERALRSAEDVKLRSIQKDPRLKTLAELHATLDDLDHMDRVDAIGERDPRRGAALRASLRQWIAPQRRDSVRAVTLMEFHKKFAIPMACLVFALCGMPLGIATRRGGRPASFVVSLGVIALWYVIYSAGDAWVQVGKLAPAIGAWLPDVTLAVVGLYLLVRLRRQQRLSGYRVLHDALILGALILLLLTGTLLLEWAVHPAATRPPFPQWPVVALGSVLLAWVAVRLFQMPIARALAALGDALKRPFRRRENADARQRVDAEAAAAAASARHAHPSERTRRSWRRRALEGTRNVVAFAFPAVLVLGAVQVIESGEAWTAASGRVFDEWLGVTLLALTGALAVLHVLGARSLRVLTSWALAGYLRAFALLVGSMLMLYMIAEYVNLARSVLQNDVSVGTVLAYYQAALPQMAFTVTPIAAMVAALVVFGVMAKFNETTAAICCGISVFRLAAPVVLLALLVSGVAFVVHDRILPEANQRADELKDYIKGRVRAPRSPAGRGSAIAENGDALYQYQRIVFDADPDGTPAARLFGLAVLRHRADGSLAEMLHAQDARWSGDAWVLHDGWRAEVGTDNEIVLERFREAEDATIEAPEYFADQQEDPALMTFPEYRAYVEDQAQLGYPTAALEVRLHHKLAFPTATFVLVLIALPFAFTTGRRGALYGLGLAVILLLVYQGAVAVFLALGEGGFLPPVVAAWAPNLLFSVGGLYLFLHVRT